MGWFWLLFFFGIYLYPVVVFDNREYIEGEYNPNRYSTGTQSVVGVFYTLAILGSFLLVDRDTEGLGMSLILCPFLSFYFMYHDKGPPPIKRKAKPKKFTGINVKTGRKINFSSKANLNKAIKSGKTESVADYKSKQKLLKKKKLKEKQKALEKKLPYNIIK